MLEDLFWESSYPLFAHDEYLSAVTFLKSINLFTKNQNTFNVGNRLPQSKLIKSSILNKNLFSKATLTSKSNNHYLKLNSLSVYSEEGFNNLLLLNSKNFDFLNNEQQVEISDDFYRNAKPLNYLLYLNSKNLISLNLNQIMSPSYTQILDSFRPNYEENYLLSDVYTSKFMSGLTSFNQNQNNLSETTSLKISNPLKLRSTAKNAIVTYNAIQKVFRSRLDEGRSNARLLDFSNSFTSHAFLTDSRVNYEHLISKNNENFFSINLYNLGLKKNLSNLTSLNLTNNIYFSEIPFLLSMKSDPSRYLWFD
jgi:hypothetical protein